MTLPGIRGRLLVYRVKDGKLVDELAAGVADYTNNFGGRLLNYQPVQIDNGQITIHLHTRALAYDEVYRAEIEPGFFKDDAGKEFSGIEKSANWEFTTRKAMTPGSGNLTVAADGAGDFCTVQGAIDAVPDDNQTPVRIFVRSGVYDGLVYIAPGKEHITLLGEDRKTTIIQGFNNDHFNSSRLGRALMNVEANDFRLAQLTVHNTTAYKGSQAEALRINADKCVLRDCDFLSFQDTLLLTGRIYVTNCHVEGDVDFIWGQGIAFFENCELKAVHAGYYVQSRNPADHLGYIFHRCKLTAASGVEKCWLARIDASRFPGSQVAFIDCGIGPHILPAGWQVTGTNQPGVRFAEYRSTDLAGNALAISQRDPAARQMDANEAADSSDPTKVFSGQNAWNPRLAASFTGKTSGESGPARIFKVRDYGAAGDGKTPDTAAIQKALDACGNAGGGVVQFSEGVYLSKPVILRNRTTFELMAGAILKATDEPADFADPERVGEARAFVPFIRGKKLQDITITGPGTIDGSGARWWGPAREAKRTNKENPGYTLPRPKLIVLTACTNVQITNVTLINSPLFHLVPAECRDVIIRDVTITAPADSPNTDAIDPSASKNVLISRCRLDVGDDNVAIKAGHSAAMPMPVTEHIIIEDCRCLHGHGISIGSETAGGVRDVIVRRCTFENTENGLRIKSPRGKGGLVENLNFTDITMKNVDPAITFTCYYPKIPAADPVQDVKETTPKFRNIHISNLTATCPRGAGLIVGLPESLVENVVLENVHITAKEPFLLRNVKGVQLINVIVDGPAAAPLVMENAEVEGTVGVSK